MSVLRSVKNRDNPFVQIDKRMFEDINLSLKAKGFIGYCLSKPNHWKFHISQLSSVLKEGKEAISSVINECVKHGYCLKFQHRRKDGRMGAYEYIISDSKDEILRIKEELKELLPKPENPLAVSPLAEGSPLVILHYSNNNCSVLSCPGDSSNHEENCEQKEDKENSFPEETIQYVCPKTFKKQYISVKELTEHLKEYHPAAIEETIEDIKLYNKPISNIKSLATRICVEKNITYKPKRVKKNDRKSNTRYKNPQSGTIFSCEYPSSSAPSKEYMSPEECSKFWNGVLPSM